MTEKKIIASIDKITPNKDAEKRMYENILKKAENTRSRFKAIRIVKPVVSAAACVCLVASIAFFLRMQINNTDKFAQGAGIAFNANETSVVLTTVLSEFVPADKDGSFDDGENLASIEVEEAPEEAENFANGNSDDLYVGLGAENESVVAINGSALEFAFNIIPQEAQEVYYDELSNTWEFVYDDHCYSFCVSESDISLLRSDDNWTKQEEISNYPELNAVLYSFESEDAQAYELCWENGEYTFSLINNDGADKSNLIDIFVKTAEIN